MNITLKHLKAFVAVAEESSFTRASKRLALSQPALTIQINQFEEELGVKLFDRTTRRVRLTSNGEEFLPTARRLLDDVYTAVAEVRAVAERRRGRVTVAALPSVATRIMPQIVAAYSARYPAVGVHMHDSNASGVQNRVRIGEVDFGISSMWAPDQDLAFEPILRDRFGLVCRGDHPLARSRAPLPWRDLGDATFLGLAADTGIRTLLHRIDDLPDSVRAPQFEVSNIATMEGLLEAGLGVSALPELALPGHRSCDLVFRPLVEPVLTRDLCLITRRGRSLTPAAEGMRELIMETLPHLDLASMEAAS